MLNLLLRAKGSLSYYGQVSCLDFSAPSLKWKGKNNTYPIASIVGIGLTCAHQDSACFWLLLLHCFKVDDKYRARETCNKLFLNEELNIYKILNSLNKYVTLEKLLIPQLRNSAASSLNKLITNAAWLRCIAFFLDCSGRGQFVAPN